MGACPSRSALDLVPHELDQLKEEPDEDDWIVVGPPGKTTEEKWAHLLRTMSAKRKWGVRGHMYFYAKQVKQQGRIVYNIDKASKTGVGKHLREQGCAAGRWGWREIPH